jgi:hypothetical protein
LPFEPKRIFIVKDVPIGTTRGRHAHKKCRQLLVCLNGVIRVNTLSKDNDSNEVLLQPGDSFLLENLVWGTQEYLTGKEIMMVFCSENYDKSDYITNYNTLFVGSY